MLEKVFAVYERESTLWKNANAIYVAQDWTKMECLFFDYSEDRKDIEEIGMRWHNSLNGEDVTERYIDENFSDCFAVRLTNNRGTNTRTFKCKTKEEANAIFKQIFNHKVFVNWKRVK